MRFLRGDEFSVHSIGSIFLVNLCSILCPTSISSKNSSEIIIKSIFGIESMFTFKKFDCEKWEISIFGIIAKPYLLLTTSIRQDRLPYRLWEWNYLSFICFHHWILLWMCEKYFSSSILLFSHSENYFSRLRATYAGCRCAFRLRSPIQAKLCH